MCVHALHAYLGYEHTLMHKASTRPYIHTWTHSYYVRACIHTCCIEVLLNGSVRRWNPVLICIPASQLPQGTNGGVHDWKQWAVRLGALQESPAHRHSTLVQLATAHAITMEAHSFCLQKVWIITLAFAITDSIITSNYMGCNKKVWWLRDRVEIKWNSPSTMIWPWVNTKQMGGNTDHLGTNLRTRMWHKSMKLFVPSTFNPEVVSSIIKPSWTSIDPPSNHCWDTFSSKLDDPKV